MEDKNIKTTDEEKQKTEENEEVLKSPEAKEIEGEENKEEDLDIKALEGKYKRALADYHNLLKQTAREKEEFARYANERLILEMIPVYDNLKMALEHVDDAAKSNGLAEGIKYVVKQFSDALKNYNVEEIKTEGEKFDHNIMEAVSQEVTDDNKKDDLVAKELSSGYKLNGKVIKAARVVVYEYKGEF